MKKGSAEKRKSHSSRKWYKRESRSSPAQGRAEFMCSGGGERLEGAEELKEGRERERGGRGRSGREGIGEEEK